jgi:hypothetical protein
VKNACLTLFALLAVATLALPAHAAMEVLNDDDLDSITAAGQPTVVISENGSATQKDSSIQTLNLVENAQVGLRALTIANVVGEAQLVVNLNVISVSGDIAGVDQRNFAVQSWGSTLPKLQGEMPGAPGVVNSQTQNPDCDSLCVAGGDIKKSPDVSIGSNNTSTTTNNASAPVVKFGDASGDVIVDGFDNAEVLDASVATLSFEPNAQTDLAALFIANIAGRTQAAFNVNIASSTLNLFPSTDSPFSEPAASSSAVLKQTNSAVQFRGTPINAAASLFVSHTP